MTLAIGSRVYYRGRHYEVRAVRESGRGAEVQIVPEGRKPHRFDWISVRSLEAAHAVITTEAA